MKKWIPIIAIVLCICFCISIAVNAEEGQATATEEEPEMVIIDFDFCVTTVTDEYYALLKTDYTQKDLSLLRFKYYDFDGDERNGVTIVHRLIEFDALDALQDLYEAKLPISDISLYVMLGFDITFWAPFQGIELLDDPYNQIMDRYGFDCNENQYEGARHYTLEYKYIKRPEWD